MDHASFFSEATIIEIGVYPFKKFAIFFSKIFKDLCTENRGKLHSKIQRQQEKRNFSILNSSARLAKTLKLEHLVYANRNNLRDLL